MSLSAEALSLIDYCPASGQLTWRTTRKGRGCKAGSPAGTLSARRAVTASDNNRNQKMAKNNVTGITGVSWHKLAGKHVAHITGKHLGLFENLFDACCARKSAEYRADFHPNHGRA